MFVLGWSNPKIWTTVPAGALSANYSESLIVNMLGFWSNPKIWTTVPAGALSANYSESLIVNMLGFYFIALPIFLVGVFFWATIGKQGNKIAPKKFGYFTAFLLIGFGIYLIYKGIISIT